MSWFDVYIGSLDDPAFRWGTTSYNGSIPHKKGPGFPDGRTHFDRVVHKIRQGVLRGKQVDNYGGYVAQVTKKELLEFLDEYYTKEWYAGEKPLEYEKYRQEVEELREYIWSLDQEKEYLLVAVET